MVRGVGMCLCAASGSARSLAGGPRRGFFLEMVFFNDALDASRGDGHAALAQFLRDDVGRGVGIEEAVSDDLAFDLIRAARRGLGSALGRRQARRRVISSSGGTQIEPEGPSSITTFLSMRNMGYRLLWEWAWAERLIKKIRRRTKALDGIRLEKDSEATSLSLRVKPM